MTTSTTSIGADFAAIVARMECEAVALSRMAADGVWAQVSLASTADLVVSLLKTGDALSAVASGGVGVVHTSGALPAGHVSTKRWLEVATGMSARSAGVKVARSMSLREGFARTRMAWLSGKISDDMVRVITTGIPLALQRLNVAEQPAVIDQIEAQIVPYAMDHSIAQVQTKLKQLRLTIDPDGIDERSLAAYDDQQLHLVPVGDGYEVRGYLTKESAAVLLTVLEQKIDGWFHDGSLTPEQQLVCGDDVMSTGRRKMRRPRLNADALIEACQDLLDSGALGSKHQQRPHVLVTVDAAEFRAGLGGLLHLPGHGCGADHRSDSRPVPVRRRRHHDPDPPRRSGDADHHHGRRLRLVARRGPRGPLRRPHPPHRTTATAQGPRHPRPALRLPRLPRRPKPLRRPPRHRMGRRRTDRPVQHAPDLQGPPHPRPQATLDHHPHARLPRRTTRRLGLHTPTTTQALSRGRRDQGAPPLTCTRIHAGSSRPRDAGHSVV